MFSQSADEPATEQSPAPIGMRELPPQPARPVMPAYTMPMPSGAPAAAVAGPGPDDSVIARDDHLEGTFTSRGTIVVMGSVKGRIEALRVRIEDGARVDADVIVDEAIIAGEFTGNLTCRERLEAHASGRINGRVETYKLMLHEGASVEGEMHMLTGAPKDASETIRGSAPLRGEAKPEGKPEGKSEAKGEAQAGATSAALGSASGPAVSAPARAPASAPASAPVTKPAPTVTPSSAARSTTSAIATTTAGSSVPSVPSSGPEATASQTRSSIVETLRLETLRVAPRATTAGPRYTGNVSSGAGSTVSNGSRGRSGTTTTGF